MAGQEVEPVFVNKYRAGGILEQSKGSWVLCKSY